MIRIELPHHLRKMAGVEREVSVDVVGPVTVKTVLDAVETAYPMLAGTIREHGTRQRRPYLRFFADGRDLSHEGPEAPLPDTVISGAEPFIVLGAISGG